MIRRLMILVVFLIYWVTRQPDPTPWDVFPEEIANRYHWSIDAAGRWTASLPPLPREAVEAELFSTLFQCAPQQEISPPAPRKDVLNAPPVQKPLPSLDKNLAVPPTEHHGDPPSDHLTIINRKNQAIGVGNTPTASIEELPEDASLFANVSVYPSASLLRETTRTNGVAPVSAIMGITTATRPTKPALPSSTLEVASLYSRDKARKPVLIYLPDFQVLVTAGIVSLALTIGFSVLGNSQRVVPSTPPSSAANPAVVIRKPANSPSTRFLRPAYPRLRRRASERNISSTCGAFGTFSLSTPDQSTAMPSDLSLEDTLKAQVGLSVITQSASSMNTGCSVALSTVATPLAELSSEVSALLGGSNKSDLGKPLSRLPPGCTPTPREDFWRSPTQSFEAYYGHAAEGSSRPRSGRKRQPLRRRHTTGKLRKKSHQEKGAVYLRTGVLIQNRVYDILSDDAEDKQESAIEFDNDLDLGGDDEAKSGSHSSPAATTKDKDVEGPPGWS